MNVTALCNKALAHLGEQRITDYHESSVLAEFCRTHYESERDALLRQHRWNFARARAQLTRLSPDPEFGWMYRYQLPSDSLRVLELNGNESTHSYSLESNRELLTNASLAQVIYTKRVTDPTQYDVIFAEALSFRLAAALAKQVTGSTSEKGAYMQMAEAVLREAGFIDAVEDRPKLIPAWHNSHIIKSRYGSNH